MDRLTERDEFGNADIVALADVMQELYGGLSFNETNALTDALNRLADYEETGLNPEEIIDLQHSWDMYGGEDGIMALYRQAENKPLTLDELRAMEGEPAWISPHNEWMLVDRFESDDGKEFVGFTTRNSCSRFELAKEYGETWTAYRRKPKCSIS